MKKSTIQSLSLSLWVSGSMLLFKTKIIRTTCHTSLLPKRIAGMKTQPTMKCQRCVHLDCLSISALGLNTVTDFSRMALLKTKFSLVRSKSLSQIQPLEKLGSASAVNIPEKLMSLMVQLSTLTMKSLKTSLWKILATIGSSGITIVP